MYIILRHDGIVISVQLEAYIWNYLLQVAIWPVLRGQILISKWDFFLENISRFNFQLLISSNEFTKFTLKSVLLIIDRRTGIYNIGRTGITLRMNFKFYIINSLSLISPEISCQYTYCQIWCQYVCVCVCKRTRALQELFMVREGGVRAGVGEMILPPWNERARLIELEFQT